MSLLAFHDVHALYGHARILNGVTFAVDAGERVALVGRNGVGKTTVVNTLCGVTRIAQGQIDVRGQTLARLRGYTAAQNGIAIVLQGRGIIPHLTVEENLLLGTATRRAGPWSLARIHELFPILRERRSNPGLALSRRPAANARDRPRADRQPGSAHSRRAERGAGAGHRRRTGGALDQARPATASASC